MLKSLAVTTALASAAAIALTLILFGSIDGPVQMVRAGAGDVTQVAIDVDIDDDGDTNPDNDDTTVGTIDDCIQLAQVGDTVDVDLVVVGVDATDKIAGYQVDIDYDPAVIRMGVDDDGDTLYDEDPVDFADNDGDTQTDEDPLDIIDIDAAGSTPPNNVTILSRIGSGGGVGYLHLSDTQTAGSATLAALDGTASPVPPANHESGDGVLARATFTAVGTGTSPLFIPGIAQKVTVIDGGVDIDGDGNIDTADDGRLANQAFGHDIVDGGVDINDDGVIDATDDGTFGTSKQLPADVINGDVDVSGDGVIGAADDGLYWIGGGADGSLDLNITAGAGALIGSEIPVDTVGLQAISVGEACTAPSPTPSPTPAATPTAAPTPTPGPTPTPTPTPGPPPTPTPAVTVFEEIRSFVGAGLSLSTDDGEDDGATADDPVETTVTTPNGGVIVIFETAITQSPPSGFTFFGQEVSIEAPDATTDDPLIIKFHLDASIIPAGEDEDTIEIFKDGDLVPDCTGASGTASPDPCVSLREQASGDTEITVLTSTASLWNFGVPGEAGPPTGPPTGPPQTGDAFPIGEGGRSVLSWLFVALGTALAFTAVGYAVYGRSRQRFTH